MNIIKSIIVLSGLSILLHTSAFAEMAPVDTAAPPVVIQEEEGDLVKNEASDPTSNMKVDDPTTIDKTDDLTIEIYN